MPAAQVAAVDHAPASWPTTATPSCAGSASKPSRSPPTRGHGAGAPSTPTHSRSPSTARPPTPTRCRSSSPTSRQRRPVRHPPVPPRASRRLGPGPSTHRHRGPDPRGQARRRTSSPPLRQHSVNGVWMRPRCWPATSRSCSRPSPGSTTTAVEHRSSLGAEVTGRLGPRLSPAFRPTYGRDVGRPDRVRPRCGRVGRPSGVRRGPSRTTAGTGAGVSPVLENLKVPRQVGSPRQGMIDRLTKYA